MGNICVITYTRSVLYDLLNYSDVVCFLIMGGGIHAFHNKIYFIAKIVLKSADARRIILSKIGKLQRICFAFEVCLTESVHAEVTHRLCCRSEPVKLYQMYSI